MLPEGWVWYFAYGSNMNPVRLFADRLGTAGVAHGPRIAGLLHGWALRFNLPWEEHPGAGFANIIPGAGAATPGTLNAMPPKGLEVLDVYEGVSGGHYERRAVRVLAAGGMVDAVTYIALNDLADGLRPTQAYLSHLLAGADLLPAPHLAFLRGLACHEECPTEPGSSGAPAHRIGRA